MVAPALPNDSRKSGNAPPRPIRSKGAMRAAVNERTPTAPKTGDLIETVVCPSSTKLTEPAPPPAAPPASPPPPLVAEVVERVCVVELVTARMLVSALAKRKNDVVVGPEAPWLPAAAF